MTFIKAAPWMIRAAGPKNAPVLDVRKVVSIPEIVKVSRKCLLVDRLHRIRVVTRYAIHNETTNLSICLVPSRSLQRQLPHGPCDQPIDVFGATTISVKCSENKGSKSCRVDIDSSKPGCCLMLSGKRSEPSTQNTPQWNSFNRVRLKEAPECLRRIQP